TPLAAAPVAGGPLVVPRSALEHRQVVDVRVVALAARLPVLAVADHAELLVALSRLVVVLVLPRVLRDRGAVEVAVPRIVLRDQLLEALGVFAAVVGGVVRDRLGDGRDVRLRDRLVRRHEVLHDVRYDQRGEEAEDHDHDHELGEREAGAPARGGGSNGLHVTSRRPRAAGCELEAWTREGHLYFYWICPTLRIGSTIETTI